MEPSFSLSSLGLSERLPGHSPHQARGPAHFTAPHGLTPYPTKLPNASSEKEGAAPSIALAWVSGPASLGYGPHRPLKQPWGSALRPSSDPGPSLRLGETPSPSALSAVSCLTFLSFLTAGLHSFSLPAFNTCVELCNILRMRMRMTPELSLP